MMGSLHFEHIYISILFYTTPFLLVSTRLAVVLDLKFPLYHVLYHRMALSSTSLALLYFASQHRRADDSHSAAFSHHNMYLFLCAS